MKRSALQATLGAALLLVLTTPAPAQNRALQQRLVNASRIECSFTTLVTGDWQNGETTAAAEPVELEAAFFDVDVEEGTAEAEGRFGASFIVVRQAQGYLHFMQTLRAGPIHLTTVLAQESSDGKLMAMHTRHEYTPTKIPGFTSRPEMYIGECTVQTHDE